MVCNSPNRYALIGDSLNPGRWNLWIPTIQTQDQVLSYLYVARRPQNALIREDRGTVSVTGGVATFSDSIVSTLWENEVVLRVSEADSSSMTGELGDVPGTCCCTTGPVRSSSDEATISYHL